LWANSLLADGFFPQTVRHTGTEVLYLATFLILAILFTSLISEFVLRIISIGLRLILPTSDQAQAHNGKRSPN
jgi:hypothetical protein